MTAISGFKRLGIMIAAVAALLAGALAILGALVPREAVRDAVAAEVRTVTGLDLVLRGPVSVSVFPSSSITFHSVSIQDLAADTPALTAERLTARLRLIPLLLGRAQIANVDLIAPTISVSFDDSGKSNWSHLIGRLADALQPHAAGTSFSEIRIVDGVVIVRDHDRGMAETVDQVELALAWPSISRSFAATGRFVWRGEPVDVSVSLANFAAALAGKQSGLKVRLSSKPVKFAFEGHMSYAPSWRIDGALGADAPSLRDALRWAGKGSLPGGGFGRFSLKAQTRVAGGTIALTKVNVELDGNAAEGALTLAGRGRTSVQGTLAADTLNLTPYISNVHLMGSGQREWSGLPFSLDGLNALDLDLRISAAQVQASSARFGRTAVATSIRTGTLAVTVGEAQAYGGIVKGSFAIGTAKQGADFKAQLHFTDVDLESFLQVVFGVSRIEGRGSMSLAIGGSGDSMLALTRSLSGSAEMESKGGALAGINLEQLLRRLERSPLSRSDFRTGRTPFDRLAVALSIHEGTISIDRVQMEGAAVRLDIGGFASIPSRELDLKGIAGLVARGSRDVAPPFELPFVVQGSWESPMMLPDAEMRMRLSEPARRLLEAVRDRLNRDPRNPAAQVTPTRAE